MKKTEPCQELSIEILEKLDKIKKEAIEKMVAEGWDRKKATDKRMLSHRYPVEMLKQHYVK